MSDKAIERWTGPAKIAWCPQHGLHGCRNTCFKCGKVVEQIPMIPVSDYEAEVKRLEEERERAREDFREVLRGQVELEDEVEQAETQVRELHQALAEDWVLGYDEDGQEAVYWHDQLKTTPWGESRG